MLARTSTLTHRDSGIALQTPLLVPSFSSKGLRLDKNEVSEATRIMDVASEWMTDCYLISAYDVFYHHIPQPAEMPFPPAIVFLDSGGYEVGPDYDLAAVKRLPVAAKPWSLDQYVQVLDAWPDLMPAVFVSYDHPETRLPFEDQVSLSQSLFKGRGHLHAFLLKPIAESHETLREALKSARGHLDLLRCFDVVGVTEKELPGSMLNKMCEIARLRRDLDEAKVRAPLHIFGALDPVSVCLYYIAGAEVFDGLTWLRYAYDDGRCVYPENFAVLKYGLDNSRDKIRAIMLHTNFHEIQRLERRLKEYQCTGNVTKLPHEDLVRQAIDSLTTRLRSGER